MTLKVLRSVGRVFCRMSLNWEFSDVFRMIRLGLWVLGRKPAEVHCCLHCITAMTHFLNVTLQCWCWSGSPDCSSVCQIPPLYSYSMPPILSSLEGSYCAQQAWRHGLTAPHSHIGPACCLAHHRSRGAGWAPADVLALGCCMPLSPITGLYQFLKNMKWASLPLA